MRVSTLSCAPPHSIAGRSRLAVNASGTAICRPLIKLSPPLANSFGDFRANTSCRDDHDNRRNMPNAPTRPHQAVRSTPSLRVPRRCGPVGRFANCFALDPVSPKTLESKSREDRSAGGGTRTPKLFRAMAPKAIMFASFITPAAWPIVPPWSPQICRTCCLGWCPSDERGRSCGLPKSWTSSNA